MSWIKKLQETYDYCAGEIGKGVEQNEKVLLPVCHTTQVAHIRVTIDQNADFVQAEIISKDEQNVITPCTESSAGRSGKKPINHPLFDKLQYLAGDYKKFGGVYTAGYEESYESVDDEYLFFSSNSNPYKVYMDQLGKWINSEYSNKKIQLVYKYLEKSCLVADLVKQKILFLDSNGLLLNSRQSEGSKDSFDIFKLLPGGYAANGKLNPWQANAFIVFSVNIPDDVDSHLDKDPDLWNCWIKYYSSIKDEKGICQVTGEESFLSDQYPSKIRNTGDKAKIISSTDPGGFVYRGRFVDARQACTIGYEISQKAHNALRWLISRQGYRDGDLAIVAWATNGVNLPALCEDSYNAYGLDDEDVIVDVAEYTSKTIVKRLKGYSVALGPTDSVSIIALRSPTKATSRLSIAYYREFIGQDFLLRLENWHMGCAWRQCYSKDKIFYGAPAPKDIAWAAFGTKLGATGRVVDDNIKRQTIERLLPCIIDGVTIPLDIVGSLVREASKRIVCDAWEWEKILGIACSVFRYSNKEKGYEMALEEERASRDYLFGRLLAVADSLESFALSQAEKGRPTNAARFMQRFAEHPCSTWRTIELALSPYKARLGGKGIKYEKTIDEIMEKFSAEDFSKDTPLSGEFLLAFHVQRAELMKKPKNEDNKGE